MHASDSEMGQAWGLVKNHMPGVRSNALSNWKRNHNVLKPVQARCGVQSDLASMQMGVVSLGQDDGEVAITHPVWPASYFLSPVTAFPSSELMRKIRVDGNHQAEITRCH